MHGNHFTCTKCCVPVCVCVLCVLVSKYQDWRGTIQITGLEKLKGMEKENTRTTRARGKGFDVHVSKAFALNFGSLSALKTRMYYNYS